MGPKRLLAELFKLEPRHDGVITREFPHRLLLVRMTAKVLSRRKAATIKILHKKDRAEYEEIEEFESIMLRCPKKSNCPLCGVI